MVTIHEKLRAEQDERLQAALLNQVSSITAYGTERLYATIVTYAACPATCLCCVKPTWDPT